MKNYLVLIALVTFCFCVRSQENEKSKTLDNKYLEDQFYIGLGYNFLLEKPTNVVQRSLSYNLQTGFIKDIPFNQRRNFGIGIGFGYATNSYYSNIVANEADNNIVYTVLDTSDFDRNKLETHAIEIPLELRWRTSTADEYKFWRIYAGAKFGYVFSGSSRIVSDSNTMRFSNNDIQSIQYGLQLSFGYNTWNIQAYYGLNPLLEDGTALENGETIDIRALRIGIIFYIL
ncbi:hypothetical protein DKG77_00495 [Flagellimonas aquimarina]|uniref:Outer membrane protein beta-barrel domain-containing protein n=1 Tax=Flagellimonas aquimarina TaxID=2201895 RepID=A0A316KYQ3_9FLAO|nr:porin family protein [Allomuricauda koreensis]PWL39352.1 hypothetical protein DKG77_00495 [Allomuricauda koreensis]